MTPIRLAPLLVAAGLLAGCATPRLHSPLELADVALRCKVPVTDLEQEADLKKVLFFYTQNPSAPQFACVRRWARQNRLHLAYLEGVDQTGP